ncbi:uncharacterized protein LOC132707066 isoform X2 [Cylas formicarius]|uniref:uncharacterized protein LOC132707066 isoform X2 n=1 Tax=Cylas formicarius TaxID=197179 RepID=UPI002958CB68|nr:uncharacterized protein LOC132707066 isoform X2 [Cylas formicarius]
MSDSEDEAEQTQKFMFKPSFVIIAIDAHPSMFETRKNEDDDTVTHAFKDALTACYEVADSLVLTSNRRSWNQFGVVVAREDEAATLVEVQNNLLDTVKLLKTECALDNEELRRRYERRTDLDLAAFFLLCKKKFRDIKAAFYKRTIVFVTNDDNPVGGDARRRFAALNEAKTFGASEVSFELVTMKHDFNYGLFYNELFSVYSSKMPLVDEVCEDKDGLVEKLLVSIVFRYTRQKYNFFPFSNDRERYLKVLKVKFFKKAKLFNSDKASRDGKLLKRVHEKSGVEASTQHQFTLRMGIGNEPLKLDLKDKYDIYGNDLPLGFHLCYVSPRQTAFGVCGKPTSMLVVDPHEDLKFFDQFWQYCVDNNRVLVCIKKTRHPEKIRYVELIPKYANDMRMFLIKHIPYCNELKWPNKRLEMAEPPNFNTTEAKKKCVEELVERKKAYVKSKLLDEPMEEVADVTVNEEEMEKQIGDVIREMKVLFQLQEMVSKGTKRKAPGRGRGGRGKRGC